MELDQLIFSSMKDGLLAFDKNYRYMRWNPIMEQISGLKASEVIGNVAFEIFPFLKEIGEDVFFEMALNGQSGVSGVRPFHIPHSGRSGYFEGHYSPLKDPEGRIIGGVGIIREVTDRILAEKKSVEFIGEKKASERFKTLVDAIPAIVWSADANGENKFVNRYGLEYVGLTTNNAQLVNWLSLIHPEDRDQVVNGWEKARKNGMPVETQRRMKRASDNSYRWVLFRAFPIRDQNGKIIEWVGTITDIHDQVIFSKRSFQLQGITADLSGAITPSQVADIIVTKGLEAVGAKKAALAILNQSQELEVVSHQGYLEHVRDAWKRIPMSHSTPLTEAVRQRRIIFVENIDVARATFPQLVPAMTESGEKGFVAIPLIVENRVIGALSLSFDRGLRVDPEKEGFLYTLAGLCSQAYERSRIYELELSARALAESANAAKTNLLASVSHEIRTPLASVIAYSELLVNDNLPPERRRSFVEALNRNGQVLVRLIDDILDLSKIESGRLHFEKVDFELYSFLAEIVEVLRHEADRKGIKFEFKRGSKIPARVTTDPFRLRQILLNICGNAIKYTERGSVRVDLEFQAKNETTPDQLIFTVVDTGVGLKSDANERLFKPFSQGLNAGTLKFRGTGLGLVISRNLARMLGGDVELISSVPNQGSAFQIRIACMSPVSEHGDEFSEEKVPQKINVLNGKRVLLAEDAQDLQELVSTILRNDGADVDIASNGEEAVHLATEKKYDLVIMDLQMPKLDGYQAASRLRGAGFENPIFAITANALADRSKSFESGFDVHLIKPVNGDRLLQTISEYVSL